MALVLSLRRTERRLLPALRKCVPRLREPGQVGKPDRAGGLFLPGHEVDHEHIIQHWPD